MKQTRKRCLQIQKVDKNRQRDKERQITTKRQLRVKNTKQGNMA